jgi:MerR family transcriptional regulator, glutamine synthetase repressor
MVSLSVLKREPTTPVYNIGVMSRLAGLPIHTLRWIEQHGLISPSRTEGNQRLFSEFELGLVREIRELMEQDVNLPGIRIILRMRTKKSPVFRTAMKPARKSQRAVSLKP